MGSRARRLDAREININRVHWVGWCAPSAQRVPLIRVHASGLTQQPRVPAYVLPGVCEHHGTPRDARSRKHLPHQGIL